ncbi:fibronectin type III domain-containing protein 1 [Elysia marginata]|uniref:Fibronectin type III domain-containing protein 1 n=1 Tax=Elysia marginata TaxID=1093978 RepID=A0AAV4FXS6_9GAST|nr:fibronectin type III domain-containing protein 1 [Elysia marginata]
MARALVNVLLVLYLGLSGHSWSTQALSIRNSPANEENCVLSFIVPRDKVKSSCDVEAKVQRRINAVETRADVYRQQVTKLSMQLEKQMVAGASRLDKIEAELNAKSEFAGSGRDTSNNLGQLSKRLAVLERGMNHLYARLIVSPDTTGKGAGSHATEDVDGASASSGRLFTDGTGEGKHLGVNLHDRVMTAEMESLVKSMMKTEMKRLTEDFKTYMQEYKKVLSLFLPPEEGRDAERELHVASETKGAGHSDGHSDKDTPDQAADVSGPPLQSVTNRVMKDNASEGDLDRISQETKSTVVERAHDAISQGAADYIQNGTQTVATASPTTSASSEALDEYFTPVNISDVYLISDDLSDTNDTFSGENPDLNATGVLGTDDGDDFNIGANRMGQVRDGVQSSTETKNSIQRSTDEKLQTKKIPETLGWMSDEVDRESVTEERLKTEIRAMLVQPFANIVSLVEKQAASLRDEIQLQGKLTQESLRKISNRVDQLDSNAEAVELRVESLSTGFQKSHERLNRVKKLEVAMYKLKKNLNNSMSLLNEDAAAESYRVDGKDLKKEKTPVKGLSHLVKLYNTNLEHHTNETTRIINEMKSEVEEKIDEIVKKIPENQKKFQSSTEQAMRSVNVTLDNLSLRIEEMENQILEQKTDLGLHMNGNERKRKNAERDFKDLRKSLNGLRGKYRDLSERFRDLNDGQAEMGEILAETNTKVTDLQLDFRLTLSDEWVPLGFEYDSSRTDCFGDQYVRRLSYKLARYVGVVLCDSHRYKIFLSKSLDEKFLNIGDIGGLGEDHCEFVGGDQSYNVTLSRAQSRYDSTRDTEKGRHGVREYSAQRVGTKTLQQTVTSEPDTQDAKLPMRTAAVGVMSKNKQCMGGKSRDCAGGCRTHGA